MDTHTNSSSSGEEVCSNTNPTTSCMPSSSSTHTSENSTYVPTRVNHGAYTYRQIFDEIKKNRHDMVEKSIPIFTNLSGIRLNPYFYPTNCPVVSNEEPRYTFKQYNKQTMKEKRLIRHCVTHSSAPEAILDSERDVLVSVYTNDFSRINEVIRDQIVVTGYITNSCQYKLDYSPPNTPHNTVVVSNVNNGPYVLRLNHAFEPYKKVFISMERIKCDKCDCGYVYTIHLFRTFKKLLSTFWKQNYEIQKDATIKFGSERAKNLTSISITRSISNEESFDESYNTMIDNFIKSHNMAKDLNKSNLTKQRI